MKIEKNKIYKLRKKSKKIYKGKGFDFDEKIKKLRQKCNRLNLEDCEKVDEVWKKKICMWLGKKCHIDSHIVGNLYAKLHEIEKNEKKCNKYGKIAIKSIEKFIAESDDITPKEINKLYSLYENTCNNMKHAKCKWVKNEFVNEIDSNKYKCESDFEEIKEDEFLIPSIKPKRKTQKKRKT